MKFAVVTPCFNPGELLVETMESVLSQTGDISVFYHVQDAGSSDGTMALLQSQLEQLERKHMPAQCKQLTFSYAKHAGDSMCGAINRGFAHILSSASADCMLWVNQNDQLMPNALVAIEQYFAQAPNSSWLIGRTLQIGPEGNVIVDTPPHTYRRKDLEQGRHNGTTLPFVTQQSTAWRSNLWQTCGELDSGLNYAGDFEYWVRAARAGFDLNSINIGVGCHRKMGSQQISLDSYLYECASVLTSSA